MATSMSLDDLVVLNDEIASLVRAGVPLELGLASWGRDLSGPLKKTVNSLGDSVAAGRSLDEALADPALHIPPVYRAVVTAGLRSGRLPSALESLADSAQHVHRMRGTVILAMIYPLMLVTSAYFLIWLVLSAILPSFLLAYETNPPALLRVLLTVGEWSTLGIAIPFLNLTFPLALLPPLVLWATVAVWWVRSQQAIVLDTGRASRLWRWVPLAGAIIRRARAASLADIFGLLIAHDVPLPAAVRLAATCTNDPQLTAAAEDVALKIEAGESPQAEQLQTAGLPPVIALLISGGARQSTLVSLARHAAEVDRRRVERDVTWLRDWLPVFLIITLGTVIGLVYCLTFFVPFTQMLEAFSQTPGSSLRLRP